MFARVSRPLRTADYADERSEWFAIPVEIRESRTGEFWCIDENGEKLKA